MDLFLYNVKFLFPVACIFICLLSCLHHYLSCPFVREFAWSVGGHSSKNTLVYQQIRTGLKEDINTFECFKGLVDLF